MPTARKASRSVSKGRSKTPSRKASVSKNAKKTPTRKPSVSKNAKKTPTRKASVGKGRKTSTSKRSTSRKAAADAPPPTPYVPPTPAAPVAAAPKPTPAPAPATSPRNSTGRGSSPARKTAAAGLSYRRPLPIFVPTVAVFLLLNYIVWMRTADVANPQKLATPPCFAKLPFPLSTVVLAMEAYLVQPFFWLGKLIFGGIAGMRIVCVAAWAVHVLEVVLCLRQCRKAGASACVATRYALGTAVGGFSQMGPLRHAIKAHQRRQ